MNWDVRRRHHFFLRVCTALIIFVGLASSSAWGASALRHVSEFSGKDAVARIQSCIDALPADGGTCVVDFEGTERITRGGIRVGSPSKAVLVQFLKGTNLEVTASDNSDVFVLFDNSGMVCENVGAIMRKGASCRIKVDPGASIHTLITNGQKVGTQETVYVRGLMLQGDAQATITEAAVEFSGVFVPTVIEDTTIYNFNAPLLKLLATASPAVGNSVVQFRDVWLNGGNLPKAQPLVIQGTPTTGNGQILFLGGAIEHQGPGLAGALIDGGGGTQTSSIAFYGTYFENATFTRQVTHVSRQPGELTIQTSVPHGLSPGTAVTMSGANLPTHAVVLSTPSPTTFTSTDSGHETSDTSVPRRLQFGGSVGVLIRDAYNVTIEQAAFWGGGGVDAVRVEETVKGRTHDIHVRDCVNAAYATGVNDLRTGSKQFGAGVGKPSAIRGWESDSD